MYNQMPCACIEISTKVNNYNAITNNYRNVGYS